MKGSLDQSTPRASEAIKQTIFFSWFEYSFESICLLDDNDNICGINTTLYDRSQSSSQAEADFIDLWPLIQMTSSKLIVIF